MTRVHMLIALCFTATLTSAGSSRGPLRIPRTGAIAPPDTEIRECPQAHDSSPAEYLLTSGTSGIPEYNDCQRFIVNRKFDYLYAIYATHPLTLSINHEMAVLVAVIRSFGGTYSRLGIRPGLSCVYLYPDRRHARVVDSASFFPCCPYIKINHLTGPVLESRPESTSEFSRDTDYPQVARWDRDPRSLVQLMGVKCGAAWCEIGPTGFTSSPVWTPAAGLPLTVRRALLIKGWYDEQTLAGPPRSVGAIATVSDIRGTIFPAESLALYDSASLAGNWRDVAYVAMSTSSEKYQATMGLIATPTAQPGTPLDPRTLNRIQICMGDSTACLVPSPAPVCPAMAAMSITTWGWARVIPAGGGVPKYKCLRRWENYGIAVLPATTRWRWVRSDETSWTKCSAGCCEVH
jgi:hypothetical protein